MKKQIFIAFALLALAPQTLTARQLSVAEALDAAGVAAGPARVAGAAPVAAYTATVGNLNTVYAVNTATGFMLLAADDVCTVPVLGIGENGAFDAGNIPAGLADMIAEYSAQIAAAATTGGTVLSAPADPSLADVAPITRTRWNQDAPYNDLAPRIDGKATYTGCVATAVAQVMKTYNYPAQGVGSRSYNWQDRTLSFDFGATTFEWDKMLDTYRNNPAATAENNSAVATLMYGVGISSLMNFGTGGSGATGMNAAIGLIRYLNYNKSAQYLSRDFYGLPQWCRMLHAELSQGYPLYYDGANSSVGHAFVIDGYRSSDGLFHVNWGWGGVSDGYYAITTLDPDNQGIGGSTEGYSMGQSAIFGLRATPGGEVAPVVYSPGEFIETGTFATSSEIGLFSQGVYSYSTSTIIANIGVKLQPAAGETHYILFGEAQLDTYYGYGGASFSVNGMADGVYTATPVFLCSDREYEIGVPVGTPQKATVTIASGQVSVTTETAQPVLTISGEQVLSPLYRSKPAVIDAVISNSGAEYYGNISARIVSGSTETKFADVLVDILDGESQAVSFIGRLPFGVRKGEATISFYDESGNRIGEPLTVEILGTAPSGDAKAFVYDVMFDGNLGGSGTEADPYVVNPDKFKVSATLEGSAGYFGDVVNMYVVNSNYDVAANLRAPLRPVTEGLTANLIFEAFLGASLQKDVLYNLYFANDNLESHWVDDTYFVIAGSAGIDAATVGATTTIYPNPVEDACTLTAPAAIERADVFGLDGTLVLTATGNGETAMTLDAVTLGSGLYMVRLTLADGSVPTVRMLKR